MGRTSWTFVVCTWTNGLQISILSWMSLMLFRSGFVFRISRSTAKEMTRFDPSAILLENTLIGVSPRIICRHVCGYALKLISARVFQKQSNKKWTIGCIFSNWTMNKFLSNARYVTNMAISPIAILKLLMLNLLNQKNNGKL